MEEKKFKTLHLTVFVTGVGDTSIQVPEEMSLEEALKYAAEHADEIRMPSNVDFNSSNLVFDEDNCDFEDD